MNKNEYDLLCEKIDYHMDRYYNQDSPEISDYEYDQLMIQLKEELEMHLRRISMHMDFIGLENILINL